jgi:prepilin-type N-terminal cleavage/methylation domain-containing protein
MRLLASTRCTKGVAKPQVGFSLIELLIVVAIILIIAAIAVPNLLRSRISANQASAVANLRTVTTASVSYWVVYTNGYPPSLDALGGGGASATCDAAILVDQVITAPPYQKSGYQYAFKGDQGNVANSPPTCGLPGFNGYLATATPIVNHISGNVSYCSSEPGIIHYDATGVVAPDAPTCAGLPTVQ